MTAIQSFFSFHVNKLMHIKNHFMFRALIIVPFALFRLEHLQILDYLCG